MIEILAASLVGAISYFVLGWIFFEFLLGKYMSSHMTKVTGFMKNEQESSMAWLFVSCLAYSSLLTLLFSQWTNTESVVEGFLIGGTIGGLISVMTSTYWWATSHLFSNFKPIVADIFAAIVTVGAMGSIVVFVLNLF